MTNSRVAATALFTLLIWTAGQASDEREFQPVRTAVSVTTVDKPAAGDYATDLRVGESVNGFPNWAERVVHEWMNRARVDPQAELAGCGENCPDRSCYAPIGPLGWNEQLNHAARFHADELFRQNYFAHDSHCTVVLNISSLYPVACDGSASCGCVGGASACSAAGCTTWNQRVGLFGVGAAGEIIASPSDPNDAFYLWLYEAAGSNACGFTGQNGHRWLTLEATGAVGVGMSNVAVGDFGGSQAQSKIPSGSHYPRQAASVQLWANWFDSAAPRSASAVVDGKCMSLALKRGTAQNGAWSANATGVGSGCHRYYFYFVDSNGVVVTYPATGSLGIGLGAACADWDSTRAAANCSVSAKPTTSSRHRAARH
jgi:hypothetical protein